MKRHEIKPFKKPVSAKTQSEFRQEIDTCVRHLTQAIEKDPKKAAKIFEAWLDQAPKSDQKKRAA